MVPVGIVRVKRKHVRTVFQIIRLLLNKYAEL